MSTIQELAAAAFQDATIDPKLYIGLGCLIRLSTDKYCHGSDQTLEESIDLPVSRLQEAGWIHTELLLNDGTPDRMSSGYSILQVFALPEDVARGQIDRHVMHLRKDFHDVIRRLDTNIQSWNGRYDAAAHQPFDLWAHGVDESLFYTFNTLQSPAPSIENFRDKKQKYIREAMEDILDPDWASGLRSALYPYQRRSAALMLEREEHSTLQLDPRLEPRIGPDGETYFYSSRDMRFYREPLFYESCRGGILAETMGLGKTLICLTLILATQHHHPKIPSHYNQQNRSPNLMTLQQTAMATIQRSSIPWKVELSRLEHHTGDDKSSIKRLLDGYPPAYSVPVLPTRWNRNTIMPPPKRLTLAPTTLIVVPRNLCKQWQSEIQKHVLSGTLSVLIMDDLRKELPPANELRLFDIVLFTRPRFEMEARDGADEQGRRLPPAHTPLICRCPYIGSTRIRDCRCLQPSDVYSSPLKSLHFKRLIVDEGHSFSAYHTTAVSVANKLVTADHRWIVSGTPAKNMIGVELDLTVHDSDSATMPRQEAILGSRRAFLERSDEADAIKSLGALASNFLHVRPWFAGDSGEPAAIWDEHIYRHQDQRKRTYSCFSTTLRRTLQALVIKTRPEDVERDMQLPPLVHKVVRLAPSFFDTATANLFSLVLIANAITSERVDQDYIFHKNNSKARAQLITNLRQSSFFWSGFSEDDVLATIKTSTAYLEKDSITCSQEDRELMRTAIESSKSLLQCQAWRTLGQTHELGLYVSDWPEDSAKFWSFESNPGLVLTGMTQLAEAQRYVDEQIEDGEVGAGLAGAGIRSLIAARNTVDTSNKKDGKDGPNGVIPSSTLGEDPVLKKRGSSMRHGRTSLVQVSPKKRRSVVADDDAETDHGSTSEVPPRKHALTLSRAELPSDSEYTRAKIVGSTSAKLSYLMDQVLEHYRNEKILIFYDGDHIAYYIAQALELLHIKHEIYAKSLIASLKSEYVVRFDQGTEERVLLMDVKQAAFGLNISSASRIYFVNPVCRPDMEAQAIKRAHRIGQTRPVHVETLILRGTLEEKMHERAQRMTRVEHMDAKLLEDDHGMKSILQSASPVAYCKAEQIAVDQMAPFAQPQQLWGRAGWQDALDAAEQLRQKKSRPNKRAKSEAVLKLGTEGP